VVAYSNATNTWTHYKFPLTYPTTLVFSSSLVTDNTNAYALSGGELIVYESATKKATQPFHGIPLIFSNDYIHQIVHVNNDTYFFKYQGSLVFKINLSTGVADTNFKLPKANSTYTNMIVSAIGHKYNNTFLVVFNATKISNTQYFNVLYEYNATTNTLTQVGPELPAAYFGSNKTAWGCGMLKNKYFILAEELFVYNGTTWDNVTNPNLPVNPTFFTSLIVQNYSRYDVSKKDSSLWFTNGQKLMKYDAVNSPTFAYASTGTEPISVIHVHNNGNVYYGGDFGGSYQSANGINNIAYYNITTNSITPLGGGIDMGSSGFSMQSITSIGDSIFVSGKLGAPYDFVSTTIPTPANVPYNDIMIWDKGQNKWKCFDSRASQPQQLIRYKNGLLGIKNIEISRNGNPNIPNISSHGIWIWNAKGASITLPPFTGAAIGINEYTTEQSLNGIKLFPNPTSGNITIELEKFSKSETVTILNILGQVVLTEMLSDKNSTLNIQNLNTGVYLLRVGNSKAIKFIKN
jgi:hypothetical protein